MLKQAYTDVNKYYYDPKFHGVDLAAKYQQADAQLMSVQSNSQGMGIIAEFLRSLNDRHTRLEPPPATHSYKTGYVIGIVGNDAYITQVRPKTDAATKLHLGDQVLAFNGIDVNRKTLWIVDYLFGSLRPSPAEELTIRSPQGAVSKVVVSNKDSLIPRDWNAGLDSNLTPLKRLYSAQSHIARPRFVDHGDIAVCKLWSISIDQRDLPVMFGKIHSHKILILDLRSGGGGYEDTLAQILSELFEGEVLIENRVGRKDTKPLLAKGRGMEAFKGKVIVLVNGDTAATGEAFARTVQLQNRGIVIGDHTAGSNMETDSYREYVSPDAAIIYSIDVTIADLLMSDGKSLEGVGVTPDQIIIPTQDDIANGRDPVLAKAAALAGWDITPEEAGKLFPFEWGPQED
jgi:C-terminal processing protease CtpA/Prc